LPPFNEILRNRNPNVHPCDEISRFGWLKLIGLQRERDKNNILQYAYKQNMSDTGDPTTEKCCKQSVSQSSLSKYGIQCWGSIRIHKHQPSIPNKATKNSCQIKKIGEYKYSTRIGIITLSKLLSACCTFIKKKKILSVIQLSRPPPE
jgi:hypothetical protein